MLWKNWGLPLVLNLPRATLLPSVEVPEFLPGPTKDGCRVGYQQLLQLCPASASQKHI